MPDVEIFMIISLSVGGAKIFLWSRVKAVEAQNFFYGQEFKRRRRKIFFMFKSLSAGGGKFFLWSTV